MKLFSRKRITIILLIIAILGSIFFLYFDKLNQWYFSLTYKFPQRSFISVPVKNPYIEKKTFTDLGISLTYKVNTHESPSSQLHIQTADNKIYLYSYDINYAAPSIIVYPKTPSDSLETAIRKTVLENSPSNCRAIPLNISTLKIGYSYPPHYETAEIAYFDNQGVRKYWGSPEYNNCPISYMSSGNLNYFLEDKDHPNTFLFIDAGQNFSDAGGDSFWAQTIQILQ